jgi:hypothetical protein
MLPATPFIFLASLLLPSLAQNLPDDARYSALQADAEERTDEADAIIALAVPEGYTAAPWYPTPHGGWTPDWAEAYAKAEELVANMTLAEKTNITTGTG